MATIDIFHPGARFAVFGTDNPAGYKPGRYYFVIHVPTWNKVSRYLRKPGTALRKARRYADMYVGGDHFWPAVTRCDELLTNPDAVPTLGERLAFEFGLSRCLV